MNEELLLKYLHGECSQEELTVINDWLSESPGNNAILFGMETAFHLPQKERFAQEHSLNRAWDKFTQRIDVYEHTMSGIKHSRRRIRLVWRYAAVVAIALFVAAAVMLRGGMMEKEIIVSVSSDDPVRELSLPDGTKVWLNQSSMLKYPESYSSDKRSVFLDGEAYFEVVKNSESPFTVDSKAIRVKVLGTAFNMKSYSADNQAEATLMSGEVEITGNNNEGQIVLSPGQRAQVDMTTKRMTVKTVNSKLDGVWRDKLIPFNESSLAEIGKILEQLYGVKIVFRDGVNVNNTYSGVIRKKNSIEDVLKLLTNSIPIKYTMSGDTIYIESL